MVWYPQIFLIAAPQPQRFIQRYFILAREKKTNAPRLLHFLLIRPERAQHSQSVKMTITRALTDLPHGTRTHTHTHTQAHIHTSERAHTHTHTQRGCNEKSFIKSWNLAPGLINEGVMGRCCTGKRREERSVSLCWKKPLGLRNLLAKIYIRTQGSLSLGQGNYSKCT